MEHRSYRASSRIVYFVATVLCACLFNVQVSAEIKISNSCIQNSKAQRYFLYEPRTANVLYDGKPVYWSKYARSAFAGIADLGYKLKFLETSRAGMADIILAAFNVNPLIEFPNIDHFIEQLGSYGFSETAETNVREVLQDIVWKLKGGLPNHRRRHCLVFNDKDASKTLAITLPYSSANRGMRGAECLVAQVMKFGCVEVNLSNGIEVDRKSHLIFDFSHEWTEGVYVKEGMKGRFRAVFK